MVGLHSESVRWNVEIGAATYDMGIGGIVGDVGTERPKCVVARVVTVSFLRRLMERIDCDSARSRERKELPASARRRRGMKVKKTASSSVVVAS